MPTRPHQGEPLPLELVNTEWMSRGERVDFFEDDAAVGQWLSENGFTDRMSDARLPLLEARAALRDALDRPTGGAEARLNAVLDHGSVRLQIRAGSLERRVEADPGWLPAWTAVSQYAELLEMDRDRVRQCAHPECVLYFHDTSRNGTRRWHSMETCGARFKAQRHYRRVQSRDAAF